MWVVTSLHSPKYWWCTSPWTDHTIPYGENFSCRIWNPKLLDVLEKGTFSIRRTMKHYCRSRIPMVQMHRTKQTWHCWKSDNGTLRQRCKNINKWCLHQTRWKHGARKNYIMREVLAAKADSSNLMRTPLLQSGKKRIIEATEDTFFGVGMNPFLASTTNYEYFPYWSNQLGLLQEQIIYVLIQSAAKSEQQQIDQLLAVGNNQREDAIRYKPLLDTHNNHGNSILSLQTIQI